MSTTTNLKLFKHDNPTTNTDQFDVEKALNQNWDKLDANAGEVTNKIQALEVTTNEKDTSQDEEIEVLKAENTLLKSQIPSATVVGETIHLEDSSNMQCQISPLGASKQETREGYNLLNLSSFSNQAINGLTITKNNDDSINVKGTPTAQTDIYLYGSYEGTEKLSGLSSGETFRIKGTKNSNIQLHTNLGYSADGNDFNKTVPEASGLTYIFYRFLSGVQFNITLYPMVYKGTEEKPYEQYGASPSIEYEAPIESVGDNINLCNEIELGGIREGTGVAINAPNGDFARTKEFIDIGNNRDIVIQYKYDEEITKQIVVYQYDKDKQYLKYSFNNSTTYALTLEENTKYIKARFMGKLGNSLEDFQNVKIEKGLKVTPYSPYGQGSIEVYNCNENLFDFINYFNGCGVSKGSKTLLENGIKLDFEDGADCYTATVVSENQEIPTAYKKVAIKVKPNTTYTLQMSSAPKCFISYLDKSFIGTKMYYQIPATFEKSVLQIDTNSKTEYLLFRFGIQNTNYTSYSFADIQLTEGTIEREYIAHQSQTKALYTQQPFRAIGDVKDRLVKVDGVWYEEHNVTRKTLNGTEDWGISATHSSTIQFSHAVETKKVGLYNLISNYLPTYTGDTTLECVLGSSYKDSIQLVLNNVDFANVEKLKEWLSQLYNTGTPLYVDYVLETPTLIECTPEQVEVLESFNTYKNVTNISSDSIGELEVTYSKDLETLYNNLSQAVLGGN